MAAPPAGCSCDAFVETMMRLALSGYGELQLKAFPETNRGKCGWVEGIQRFWPRCGGMVMNPGE